MTPSRFVIVALCACGVAATAPVAAAATTPSRAAVELSAAGKRALKARSITVASTSFAVGEWSVGASAKIALEGTLRFRSGKRTADATRLELTIGRTSSYVSARLGGASVRLLAVTPTRPAVLDAETRQASLTGARVALTPAAARRLRAALKLKRAPSTAAIGRLTVAVAAAPQPQPVTPVPLPAPAANPPTATATPAPSATATPTPTATATATPSVTATPGPDLACPDRFAATPAGIVDWFGCDLPGTSGSDLKSWTNYIQSPFPQVPCQGPRGTVVPGGGAARVVAGDAYDHRFPILSSEVRGDGSATIVVGGDVTYTMPVHGIEETIGSFRIELAGDGLTGKVYADGRVKPRDMSGNTCTTPPSPYAGEEVLTLDLTGITPVTAGGVKRWIHVPAAIAPNTQRIAGGSYPAGSAWGAFTIAVPEP